MRITTFPLKTLHFFLFINFFCFCFSQEIKPLYKIDEVGIELSHSPGIYEKSISLEIKGSKEDGISIIFSDGKKKAIEEKSTFQINETQCIKIIKKGDPSVYTGTYIIGNNSNLPVIALQLDYERFLGEGGILDGYMTEGQGREGTVWQKNSLNTYFEYLTEKDHFGGNFKIKPHGGFTLGLKEKSLRIYSDTLIGPKYLKINPFENRHFDTYKSVILRTSGSDQGMTRVKDIMLASLAKDMGLDFQDYRQSLLYVNGTYFGIYNIREKINKEYLKYNYGAEKDSSVLLEIDGSNSKSYRDFLKYINQDFPSKSAFDSLNSKMHVAEYLQWIILQTHIQNIDSRGNIRFWKASNLDDKWRWIFFDGDLGCDLGSTQLNYLEKRTSSSQTDWYNPTWSTQILRDIIKYEPLKDYFISQYCLMLGTQLHLDTILNRIDYFANNIRKEIPNHVLRRENIHGETSKSWEAKIKSLKRFFEIRNENAYEHIMDCFGLDIEPVFLEAKTSIKGLKGIQLKYSTQAFSYFKAKFFPEIPVHLIAAETDHLYQFDHWNVANSKEKELIVNVAETNKVKAFYKHRSFSDLNKSLYITQVTLKHTRKEMWYACALYNDGDDLKNVDVILYSQGHEKGIKIHIQKLGSGKFLYVTNNAIAFKDKFKKNKIIETELIEGFDIRLAQWVLTDGKNQIIDSAFVTFDEEMVHNKKTMTAYRDLENGQWTFGEELSYDSTLVKVTKSSSFWGILAIILGLGGLLFLLIKKRRQSRTFNSLLILCMLGMSTSTFAQTKDKFGLDSVHTKLIDNKGKGYDSIYGLRNMRVVLKNIVYRGGNNNPASVQNPLTLTTLRNLNENGFDEVIYLYSKNFASNFPQNKLDSIRKTGLNYVCKPRLDSTNINYILQAIQTKANGGNDSLIYLHCWNGWHQSGWISSIILMQYCDYSNQEALQYWAANTDRNYIGYEHVKSAIMKYKVNESYNFTSKQKADHCPCRDQAKLDRLYIVDDILHNKPIKTNTPQTNIVENKPEVMMENYPQLPEGDYKVHVVSKGDTLYRIANNYGITIDEICRLNQIESGKTLKSGQRLRIN